ncbi:magnesium transporter CorA family protein [Antrihabitans cavernicola]|uniref:Magnesium transporter CorA family protein n=1 Tax=Antrihabitans cavernicola TaxID=2495913 RepID=A0A5A7S6T6_9NOCA|nr:magnesium transporter CorA family protein [Spelaeibacter cavernicola]KAA0016765.1 magnesium transporter CorA family protein [Spelaeibacter cavernicola]
MAAPSVSCELNNRVYRGDALVAHNVSLDELTELRHDDSLVVWFDLLAPSSDDLKNLGPLLGGQVELHRLAIESALSSRSRPRLVRFAGHKMLHTRSARLADEDLERDDRILTTDITLFILDRTLVTIRSDDGFPLAPVLEAWDDNADLAGHGVPFLLHGLLDKVVSGYLDVLDTLDERISDLEDELLESSAPIRVIQRGTFTQRRAVTGLSRIVLPMNEVFGTLVRSGAHPNDSDMVPYYQDVYDHALRATERIDGLRDTIESILSTGLAMQGNSLNETMKKLTAWAAIIAVPTGVTGYFGQNVPFPGYDARLGFWLSTVLLLGLGFGLWLSFKRRDWL